MRSRQGSKTVQRKPVWLTLLASLLAGCGNTIGSPEYGTSDCRRLELIDTITNTSVVGVEDIVLDQRSERLIVSAYDRRATEGALKKEPMPPVGSLYAIAVGDIFTAGSELGVEPLVAREAFGAGLRPHGLDFNPETGTLSFINRSAVRRENAWHILPKLISVAPNGTVMEAQTHCAANDLVMDEDGFIATFDHASCGRGAFWEDVFGAKKSGAINQNNDVLTDQLGFANGIVRDGDKIFIAATREKAIYRFQDEGNALALQQRFNVDGAPDNLSLSAGGNIVAALHPSLFRLALNRKLGIGKSPSRIVRIDPKNGRQAVLFDDPSGGLFSAATVGVETSRGLLAGSVTDSGILVCERHQ